MTSSASLSEPSLEVAPMASERSEGLRTMALARIRRAIVGCEATLLVHLETATVLEVSGKLEPQLQSLLPCVATELLSEVPFRSMGTLLRSMKQKKETPSVGAHPPVLPAEASLFVPDRTMTFHRALWQPELAFVAVCGADAILAQLLLEVRQHIQSIQEGL